MPETRPRRPRRPIAWGLLAIVTAQVVCALFFVWGVLGSVIGLRREAMSWQARELMEIAAAFGLLLGVGLGAALLFRTLRRNRIMERRIRKASAAFAEVLEERFADWGLTPSERDVAWFTVKGLSIADIARLRRTSEGTVKAQSNAIYRKAGVSGRTQLLSLFIEELMADAPGQAQVGVSRPAAPQQRLARRAARE
jgi:DNA-binding CsgD family transcriptional regulator